MKSMESLTVPSSSPSLKKKDIIYYTDINEIYYRLFDVPIST